MTSPFVWLRTQSHVAAKLVIVQSDWKKSQTALQHDCLFNARDLTSASLRPEAQSSACPVWRRK